MGGGTLTEFQDLLETKQICPSDAGGAQPSAFTAVSLLQRERSLPLRTEVIINCV